MFKSALRTLLILCASAVIGVLLLVLVFSLPNGRISAHVGESLETLNKEGTYPALIKGTPNTTQDNYSDAIMLNIASYNEKDYSLVERAMLLPRYHVDEDEDQIAHLNEHYAGKSLNTLTYGRYWHGYLTYIRPLLVFSSYDGIRFVLLGVNLALSALFIVLLYKKTGVWPVVVFVLMYILGGCFIGGISLMNFNMIFVTQISGIVLLQFYEKLKRRGWIHYFFLLVGILTSFFDLLTFPVVTLGINLCLCVLLDRECSVKKLIAYSLMWCVGYAGMWVLKWVIGSLLTGRNLLADAMGAAEVRSGNAVPSGVVTYPDVISRIFSCYSTKSMATPFILVSIVGVFWVLKHKNTLEFNKSRFFCLIFIIAIPFVWYLALKNHSYIHVMFTFRTLTPALIGVLLIKECFVESEGQHKPAPRQNFT